MENEQTIKAIPTRYEGVTFRSRLEARWALFFDAIGTAWEYEPQGYDLGDGMWYLPDFWIPEWGCYVEIKPTVENTGALVLASMLAEQSRKGVIVIMGYPNHDQYSITYFDPDGVDGVKTRWDGMQFGQCRDLDCLGIWLVGDDLGATPLSEIERSCPEDRYPLSGNAAPFIDGALQQARAARFERH